MSIEEEGKHIEVVSKVPKKNYIQLKMLVVDYDRSRKRLKKESC